MADVLNYFLTGVAVNELTRISTGVLYNQVEKKMEESIFKKLDLPRDIFPPLVDPGKKIGSFSSAVAKELEVDPIPVIVPASHDTASAVTGIPVTDFPLQPGPVSSFQRRLSRWWSHGGSSHNAVIGGC